MASPYGPPFGTPGFASASHGTPVTGPGRSFDDFQGREFRDEHASQGASAGGYGRDRHEHNNGYDPQNRDVRQRQTAPAPDFAPLLFGASPRVAPYQAREYGGETETRYNTGGGMSYDRHARASSIQTPGGSRGRGFFGANGNNENTAPNTGGGKRIFGGGVQRTPNDLNRSDSLRGDRSPRLSGSRPNERINELLSPGGGHLGTPWGTNRSGAGGVDDGLNDDELNGDENEGGKKDDYGRWVTVYGFDSHRTFNSVLLEFQKDGDIEKHVLPPRRDEPDSSNNSGMANYVHVRFATAQAAKRALRLNGRQVGSMMVGVKTLDAKFRKDVLTGGSRDEHDTLTPSRNPATRVHRPSAGGVNPQSRAHAWRPDSNTQVKTQPRRVFWEKVTEFIFGC